MHWRTWVSAGAPLALLVGCAGLAGCSAAGPGGPTPSPSPSVSATPGTSGAITASGASYRYIWTSRNQGTFTASDRAILGADEAMVIIEKTHDHANAGGADQDAAAIAAGPGKPKVLFNLTTRAAVNAELKQFGKAFTDAWILRDATGNKIADVSAKSHKNGGRQDGWQVDLSNAEYRRFLVQQVTQRLRANPSYAGVMLDAFHPVIDNTVLSHPLPPGKGAAVNAGLGALVSELKSAVGPGKVVAVNGVARGQSPKTRGDRGFSEVAAANVVQDEFFCYLDSTGTYRPADQTWADVQQYRRMALAGKTMLHSVKLRTNEAQAAAAEVKRFCFAAFLMGYVPGHSLIQFKAYGNEDLGPQIENSWTPEQALGLGAPSGDPTASGTVWSRQFQHGWVVANAGTAAATVDVPAGLVLRSGPAGASAGTRPHTVTLPAHEAAYFTR